MNQETTSATAHGLGVVGLSAAGFEQHRLHRDESVWSNTNCYLDVWIELLHGLGHAPEPMFAAAVAAAAQTTQFEFLKVEHRDLEEVYGIRVGEHDIWLGLQEQVLQQLDAGHAMLIEADAFWLPDTRGVSYGIEHTKTSIVVLAADPPAQELVYLHNEGLHRLGGEDFDRVLGPGRADGIVPSPYTELIRLDGLRSPDEVDAVAATRRLLRLHASRAPRENPAEQLMAILRARFEWLGGRGMDGYHALCFETTRQLGVVAMLAAEACRHAQDPALETAAQNWTAVSEEAKGLQFQLARVARGRASASIEATMGSIADRWAAAAGALSAWAGGRSVDAGPRG
ncbi:DUF1839 family protein [Kocuria palustris]|uniref:DUF1839 family protein n=1 Tax=Kocuria palustris TaxID=71999 RepID=UPI00164299F6|nr:DUF1839 family protein [Kocuria palustris]